MWDGWYIEQFASLGDPGNFVDSIDAVHDNSAPARHRQPFRQRLAVTAARRSAVPAISG